jgi:hypothetical protein
VTPVGASAISPCTQTGATPANRAAWGTTLDLGGVPKQIMKAGGRGYGHAESWSQSDLISVVTDGMTLRAALLASSVASSSIARGATGTVETAQPPVDAEAPTTRGPEMEPADWTRLRDHLLAVLLARDAHHDRSDDDLRSAIDALAKDTVAHYPSCFLRKADGTVAPGVGLADAYKLRLGRLWEPLPRDAMRKGLALLPRIIGSEPVALAEVTSRLAEAANGELTQAQGADGPTR